MKRLPLVGVLLIAPVLLAADWPQWLGPDRNGTSHEVVKAWKEPLKVLWKKPVGEGHSSPVVANGRVLLHTRVGNKDEESLSAFDAKSGELLWKSAEQKRGKFADPFKFGSGPRATPAVFDGKAYTFGITGLLTCIDTETGKLVWEIDTLKKYKANNLFFGVSSSPMVRGDLVLVTIGGKGSCVVAFDRETGEEVWKSLDDNASYSSPITRGKGKDREIVCLTGKRLVGLSPIDGKLLWDFPLVDKLSESSTTPVVAGDILFGSSVTYGGVAIKLEKESGKTEAKEVWKDAKYNCYFSTPVAAGKDLYMVTGSLLQKKATLRCVQAATGKQHWTRENVGAYHASLLRTGDGNLLMLEEDGDLVLIEPDSEQYRELARSKICGNTWAHPALSDGRLYVRDKNELICVQLP